MRELLETVVKGIVNNPEEVKVVERESVDFPGLIILEVEVADSDKGILIGRKGRTINAIRDIITISAIRNDKRVRVTVKDDRAGNGNGRDEMSSDSQESTPQTDEPSMSASDVDAMLEDEI